jgi:hypothetical protein
MNEQEQQMMEQQQYDNQFSNYPVPMVQRNDKADMIDKINPDVIVETIRHKLMGEELFDGEWKKTPLLKERALSELGAWDISNIMLGCSSRNVSLSKLTNDEIRARTLNICIAVQRMLLKNWKLYGIKGVDQFSFVHQIVISNTFITLKQQEGEGIRNLIKGTTHEQRLISNQEKQKKSFLSGLLRGG